MAIDMRMEATKFMGGAEMSERGPNSIETGQRVKCSQCGHEGDAWIDPGPFITSWLNAASEGILGGLRRIEALVVAGEPVSLAVVSAAYDDALNAVDDQRSESAHLRASLERIRAVDADRESDDETHAAPGGGLLPLAREIETSSRLSPREQVAELIWLKVIEPFAVGTIEAVISENRIVGAEESLHLRAALDRIAGEFARLKRMASNPMKSWDAGRCIEAEQVEEIADEAMAIVDAALAGKPLPKT